MNPYRHLTIIGIIVLAAIVFAGDESTGASFADRYGAVPSLIVPAFRELMAGNVGLPALKPLLRLATSLFLHGSPEHIIYNMVFLWTFGYLTSEYLGQWRALAVFLVCGICGNIAQVALEPDSTIPIIGASGAISGFAGVYLGLALRWQLPWSEVWPLAYPVPPIRLGAFALVGFAGDVFFLTNRDQGIAYGAHVGGFLAGLAIALAVTAIYPTLQSYNRAGLRT
jgi:membrane associated rhomboid family serine protease